MFLGEALKNVLYKIGALVGVAILAFLFWLFWSATQGLADSAVVKVESWSNNDYAPPTLVFRVIIHLLVMYVITLAVLLVALVMFSVYYLAFGKAVDKHGNVISIREKGR